jgi:hypothetical protein
VYKFFTLATCLLLAACASQPHPASAPRTTLEAVHDTTLIPLPVNTSLLTVKAEAARNSLGNSLSSYRVYALPLKKGEPYRLNIASLCDAPCSALEAPSLKPTALLLDANGAVIPSKQSRPSALGQVSIGWEGEALEDATYYLLVAADSSASGPALVIDDIWVNNSPLMAVKVGR